MQMNQQIKPIEDHFLTLMKNLVKMLATDSRSFWGKEYGHDFDKM